MQDAKPFLVYRSSAGSGKTFTLVSEYLKIILERPEDFRHVLAITFTNKAANEMKQRVVHALTNLSGRSTLPAESSMDQLLSLLQGELKMSEQSIRERAGEALDLILHHYSEFAIGTIDSFSHRVIRAFAHDFSLPVSFNVELDSEMLLTTAVGLLLDKAGEDKSLTDLLVRFLETRMDEDKTWNIDKLLVTFAKVLMDEEGQEHINRLRSLTLHDFHRIAEQVHRRIRSFEDAVGKPAQEAVNLIEQAELPYSAFYQGSHGIKRFFEYVAHGRMDKIIPNKYVLTTMEEDKWCSGKITSHQKERLYGIKGRLQDLFQEIHTLTEHGKESWTLYKLLAGSIYPIAVLNEIDAVMDGFKRQNNIVHISEFNRRIAGIVMNEPVPFIFERLGERYHHILIDEFQDTSRLQWMNLVPLVENSLAGGYFNLIVGDGKQAIYRWRNGDVEQFTSLPALPGSDSHPLLRQREQVLKQHFREADLNCNYRSGAEIVDFNNRFFHWLTGMLDPSIRMVYRGVVQEPGPLNPGGYIRIEFLDDTGGEMNSDETTFGRIVEIIESLREDEYALKDIAILCRTNPEAGRIARQLILSEYPVVSSESLLLSYSPEVNFLMNFIRFLYDSCDTVILASLARYLYQGGKVRSGSLHDLFNGIAGSTHPVEHLFRILDIRDPSVDQESLLSLPLYDLCEELIRCFMTNRFDPYIQFFLDAVLQFTNQETHNTFDFIQWWDEHKKNLSIVAPEGLNSIRIMTIHKAKGLQFPVVIYPFATGIRRLTRESIWVDLEPCEGLNLNTAYLRTGAAMEQTIYRDKMQEEKNKSLLDMVNLLYVTMTRPENRLYILTKSPSKKPEELKSLQDLFAGYLQSTGMWMDGQAIYEFGKQGIKRSSQRSSCVAAMPLPAPTSSAWRNRVRIKPKAPELWQVVDPEKETESGTAIHNILCRIRIPSDLDSALEQAILSGLLDHDKQDLIRRIMMKVFTHPALAKYYSNDVLIKNEPEILKTDGTMYRPDRVVFDGDEIVLIEYKTGKKKDWHFRQIGRYREALSEMGYQNIKKFLIYLKKEPEVVTVDET